VVIEDNVFIGSSATFTNTRFPNPNKKKNIPDPTIVKRNVSIGANSTLLSGVTIGERSMVGAGSVVNKHVPPEMFVVGNPAVFLGYYEVDHWAVKDGKSINKKLKDLGFSLRKFGRGE